MKLKLIALAFTLCQLTAFSQKTDLFNTKNSKKWVIVLTDKSKSATDVFSLNNGILSVGNATSGYIRTKKAYKNYSLKVDWRWTKKPGNSGVLLHIQKNDSVWPKCYQVQQKADAAGDIICMNGLWATECTDKVKFTIPKMQTSNEKPAGEWNEARIIAINGAVEYWQNGVKVVQFQMGTENWKKLCADSKFKNWPDFVNNPAKDGYIGVQDHGNDVWFKNIKLKELK